MSGLWLALAVFGAAAATVALVNELMMAWSEWSWRREFGEPLGPVRRRRLRRAFWHAFSNPFGGPR